MKRFLLAVGILLVLLGIVGLVHPDFTYHEKKEVAKLGPMQATVEEEKVLEIPKAASIIVALAGLALVILAPRSKP
jgi:hypothetical protein